MSKGVGIFLFWEASDKSIITTQMYEIFQCLYKCLKQYQSSKLMNQKTLEMKWRNNRSLSASQSTTIGK